MKALFFINTLSNGGAEKVCLNLSNEMIRKGFKVDFIILGKNEDNPETYQFDPKIKIYNLNINSKNKIIKILKILFSIPKVNKIIKESEKHEKYDIITSHLPMANLITRLSNVKKRAIYVFHLPLKAYENSKNKYIYKIITKIMYKNKKAVAVSNKVKEEAVNLYKLNSKDIETIYNPIDVQEIQKLKDEKIDIKDNYILHVGRFDPLKRQDRMLEIFIKGKFYEKYKLIFCGDGRLKDEIKQKVKNLNIGDKIIFLDWQSNVYKWMNNADVLVVTSDYESFSMVIVEALTCGTKVVSANCDFGPREIMKKEYAKFLVKKDDIDEYIIKINKALDSYPTAKNNFVNNCLPDKVLEKYMAFAKKC